MVAMIGILGGFIVVLLAIAIVMYVLSAIAIMKVLTIYGYANPWMAWIPFAQQYALADAMCEGSETFPLFEKEIPSLIFKLWWIAPIICIFIPMIGSWISLAVSIIFGGTIYGRVFARIEGKDYKECQVIGYVSGFISLVAIIKFLTYDKNQRLA